VYNVADAVFNSTVNSEAVYREQKPRDLHPDFIIQDPSLYTKKITNFSLLKIKKNKPRGL